MPFVFFKDISSRTYHPDVLVELIGDNNTEDPDDIIR